MNGPASPALTSPPPPRHAVVGTGVAWAVIAACVTLIALAGLRPRSPEPLGLDDAARAAVPESDPRAVKDVDLLIQSRFAVGVAGAGAATSAPMLTTLDAAARRSAIAQVRVAAVAGEVAGDAAAIERLDALSGAAHLPPGLRGDVETLRTIYAAENGADALDPARRADLLARHGWYAQLALARGKPPGHPDRVAALAPATRTAWSMTLLFALGAAAFLAGLGLLIAALVRRIDGRMRLAYAPPARGRHGPFVEAFAVYIAGMVLVSAAAAQLTAARTLAANWVIAAAIPLAIAWPRLRGLSWPEVRAGFGWHRGGGWPVEVACGVGGYVAGIPLLALAVLLTSFLTKLSGTTPTHPIVNEAAGGGVVHVFQLYALAALYAPIVEETMFRGALYHHVRARLPWWLAALLVGVLFAAIHPQGWVGVPMLATVAFIFAVLREWRGSIVAPVVAHACVNGVTVTMLVLMTG